MNQERYITEYLHKIYQPQAIILHGSRAIHKERPHSDWDIFLLFNEKPKLTSNREMIANEDVEWVALTIPISDSEILDTCGVQLQYARVLFEENLSGTALLEQASAFYAKGFTPTLDERRRFKQFLTHKLDGMEDDIQTPFLFLRHQYAFFERATNWWFELRGEYRKPFYIALPLIKESDSEYHRLLLTVCEREVPETEKIAAGRKLVSTYFD
jgi:hypothetical protein